MEAFEMNFIPIKLELKFSDSPLIYAEDFISLIKSFDQINNVSHILYSDNNLELKDINSYSIENLKEAIVKENTFQIINISKQSPLVLTIVFSTIGAFLTILHIAKEIRDWDINREKGELELEKLKYETESAYIELQEKKQIYNDKLNEPENDIVLNQITNNLSENDLKLNEIKVTSDQSIPRNVKEPVFK